MAYVFREAPGPPSLFTGPPRYVASSPWGPLSAAFVTLAVFGGQILGVLLVAALVKSGTDWLDGAASPADYTQLSSPLAIVITIASQLTSILLVWLFAGRGGRRRAVLQLEAPRLPWTTYVAGGLIAIVATGIVEAILYIGLGYDIREDTSWLSKGTHSPLWLGAVVMAVVLAPLWEELTFRGFLLSALAQTRLGFWGGAVIANMAWTALHGSYSLPGLVSVFVAGIVMSWLLWRTGSIRVPIVAHAMANTVAVIFAYVMGT